MPPATFLNFLIVRRSDGRDLSLDLDFLREALRGLMQAVMQAVMEAVMEAGVVSKAGSGLGERSPE